ncbi:hypothetical protein LEP1GSC120_2223 [Leptospira santarosai str. 200702252]|nr:hypothetical protein LEP1GSC130_1316 [Leptospira santarosai str. 200403458]EMO98980.1 hypothetical protein LEP1GSC120_2223 [Leptospira santarosai str. 200702252]
MGTPALQTIKIKTNIRLYYRLSGNGGSSHISFLRKNGWAKDFFSPNPCWIKTLIFF